METNRHGNRPRPVLTQTQNNTTLWVGHLLSDPNDHFAGQTFTCPASGELDNIQLFSSAVHYPGEVLLTLHSFDTETKQWGPALSQSTLNIRKDDEAKWIRFGLPSVPLAKGGVYGFRLQTDEALVGIGEAASSRHEPFTYGQEWNADSRNAAGHFYTYFSLAFKVELCA